uniref:Uncharacterized protein n=1 Tax=Euplotes crassus TaxID=5936 RepID=A0A7S3KV06_EUPCR|mmetsp:Transcript_458/g.438  ORF Transcript_458/g.438 Transcript_458/m.438 type:complete len:204 (+) Transcript_458:461-1072(+)
MKKSLNESKQHNLNGISPNGHPKEPNGLREKKEFKTQKITNNNQSMNIEFNPTNPQLMHKGQAYFQRLQKTAAPSNDARRIGYDYLNLKKFNGDGKYPHSRVSRSTVINSKTKETAVSNHLESLNKNHFDIPVQEEYHQNVKFVASSPKDQNLAKRSARDLSTGVQRFSNEYSLINSKEEVYTQKGRSYRRSKLPQIIAIDPK